MSVRSEASCGVEFREGRTYLVLGSHQQAGGTLNLASTLCNGTRELAAVPAADLAVLGPGQAPPPVVAPTPATEPAGDGAGVRIAAGLGVLVATALVGVAVQRQESPLTPPPVPSQADLLEPGRQAPPANQA